VAAGLVYTGPHIWLDSSSWFVKLVPSSFRYQFHIGIRCQCWGGGIWSHILLGLYPPQLYSIDLWIGYLSVHILVTGICYVIPSIPRLLSPCLLDTLLFPLDATLRLGSITSTLDLVHTHADPHLSQSLFLRLIISAVASAGGGVTAATLAVWTHEWRFTTPVFLRGGVVATIDIWGGMLAGFVYGLFTASHPTYQYLLLWSSIGTQKGPILTPLGARSAATAVLMVVFTWRVILVHWIPTRHASTEKKEKTQ